LVPRGLARERECEREHDAAAHSRAVRTVYDGDKEDYASERARVDVGNDTCKKSSSQPGTKAGITSSGAAALSIDVRPRLDG
jgi:hypothetical protein